jgi:hypothetical protein
MIATKVVETSGAPEEGFIESRRRVSTSSTTTVWGHARSHDAYLQTVDWLLLANNGEALFVKGMDDLCTGRPGAIQLLAHALEEGHQPAAFVLGVLNYYKHGATEDVFNLFRRVYGEVTIGYQAGSLSWTDEGINDEADASTARVHHQVDEEIGRVTWREQININIVYQLHMPDDDNNAYGRRDAAVGGKPSFVVLDVK